VSFVTARELAIQTLSYIRDGRPASWDADFERRWQAAREVSDGVVEAVHVAAWLSGPRRSHSLFEGIEQQ